MQNTLHWQTGYLARQAPVLAEREGLARKVKPLVRLYTTSALSPRARRPTTTRSC